MAVGYSKLAPVYKSTVYDGCSCCLWSIDGFKKGNKYQPFYFASCYDLDFRSVGYFLFYGIEVHFFSVYRVVTNFCGKCNFGFCAEKD